MGPSEGGLCVGWVCMPGASGVGILPVLGAHPSCPADVHDAAGCTHVSLHVHVSMWAAHLHTSCVHACQGCPSVHMHNTMGTHTDSEGAYPCSHPRLHAHSYICMHIACLL